MNCRYNKCRYCGFKSECKIYKENAELKAEIENDKDLPAIAYMQGAEKQKEKDKDQLTKAKVALRKVVDYLGQFCSDYPDCVIEAEKILKEE